MIINYDLKGIQIIKLIKQRNLATAKLHFKKLRLHNQNSLIWLGVNLTKMAVNIGGSNIYQREGMRKRNLAFSH